MKVLKADCGGGDAYADRDFSSLALSEWFLQADFWIPASTFTALAAKQFSAQWLWIGTTGGVINDSIFLTGWDTSGGSHNFSSGNRNYWTNGTSGSISFAIAIIFPEKSIPVGTAPNSFTAADT